VITYTGFNKKKLKRDATPWGLTVVSVKLALLARVRSCMQVYVQRFVALTIVSRGKSLYLWDSGEGVGCNFPCLTLQRFDTS
jgi:hypothetical protein